MARTFRRATAAVNAEADAVCKLLDGGVLRLYNGLQPDTADTAVTDQDLLAELQFGSPAFQKAVDGRSVSHSLEDDPSAETSGNAYWFRAVRKDGKTAVFDGSVGTRDDTAAAWEQPDLILNSVTILQGANVSISSLTYTAKK